MTKAYGLGIWASPTITIFDRGMTRELDSMLCENRGLLFENQLLPAFKRPASGEIDLGVRIELCYWHGSVMLDNGTDP